MKKKLSLFFVLVCAFFLVSCSSSEADEKTTIKIGTMPSVDALPLAIAKEKGYFDKYNVDVQLEVFTSPLQRDSSLQANEIQGVIADSVALGLYQNADLNMKVVSLSSGNFNLIVPKNSNIKTLKDLKDKKIIISENTVIDFLNDQLLKEAKLSDKDIEKVVIAAVPARLEALNNKQADAVILPAPYDVLATEQGNKVIKTIVNEQQQISMVLLNNDILTNNQTDVENFVKAYNEAINYLNDVNPEEIKDLLIETVGYDKNAIATVKLPHFIPITLPKEEKVQEALDWSKNKGIIEKDFKAKDLMVDISNASN